MSSLPEVPVYMLSGVPMLQPSHLEGLSDPALSTEILPGPPELTPLMVPSHKRDPKKLSTFVSYLPPSDPGSTYSGLVAGSLGGSEVDGPRRKRARVDKGTAAGRAQRANARSLNNSAAPTIDPIIPEVPSRQPSVPLVPDSDSLAAQPDSDDPSLSLSRANSLPGAEEPMLSILNGRGRTARKDKGKGKEPDSGVMGDEGAMCSLSPEPSFGMPNDDHCSSCRSLGALVYCDSCPRAFHLWCLDPPMEAVDLPEGEKWFCPGCLIRKHPPSKPTRSSFMSLLIHQLQMGIPREFQLPEDIRNFFRDVATGANGTYVDSSELKQPRLNRHGQLEDRDPYRLKDRNGIPVICFRCGKSALPTGVVASTSSAKHSRRPIQGLTPEGWRSMISCDYCNLHWHLDCLDPPLTSMPSYGKKWMCPNHADQVLHPKRRIPKQSSTPFDVTKPKQWNNGNIEVIHPQPTAVLEKLVLDEVLINGRRYRVPERVIMLDFWSKIGKDQHKTHHQGTHSGMSSPLTSLSSLDEVDDFRPLSEDLVSPDELHAAQLLFDLHYSISRRTLKSAETSTECHMEDERAERLLVDSSVQTDPEAQLRAPASSPRVGDLSAHKRKGLSKALARDAIDAVFTDTPPQIPPANEHPSPAKQKRARIALKQEQDEDLALPEGMLAPAHPCPEKPGRRGRGRRKAWQMERTRDCVPSGSSNPVAIAPAPAATSLPPTSTPSSTTLKIRLPRLTGRLSAVTAPVSQSPSSSISPLPDTLGSAETRSRRSSRRQGSATISVSGASSFTPDDGDDLERTKSEHRPPKHGAR